MTSQGRLELAVVIVNFGVGSKVLKLAKQHGVSGVIAYLGMGTVKNRILEFLELADIRKEIVMMEAETSVMSAAIKCIDEELELHKPYHGIAYTMTLSLLVSGTKDYTYEKNEGGNIMYSAISVIVERGKAELVMETATEAGARGGTVIKARGAGAYKANKLFNMDIEPEKEVVMILAKKDSAEKIVTAIRDRLEIGKAGHGVIFCQDVNSVYGVS